MRPIASKISAPSLALSQFIHHDAAINPPRDRDGSEAAAEVEAIGTRRAGRRPVEAPVVILAMEEWTALAVAIAVGLSRPVCQEWVYRFNEQGLAGLEDQRGRQSTSPLTPAQEQQIRQRIDAGPTAADGVCSLRGADVKRFLQQEFGLVRSLAAVYHLLHGLGYSYLRPRPRHRLADPEAQAAFRRELPDRLRDIAAAHPDKRLRVYFQDESRFGQQGTLTNVWAPKGSRRRPFGRPSTSTCG